MRQDLQDYPGLTGSKHKASWYVSKYAINLTAQTMKNMKGIKSCKETARRQIGTAIDTRDAPIPGLFESVYQQRLTHKV